MMVNYKERKTISGEEALEEFLASKERWNAYVDKHNDNTEVDFSGVDFSKHRKGKGEFNFSEYLFPKNGGVSFASAIFGEGGVFFTTANFGDGDVSFSNTKFEKNGAVFFDEANFGDGEVNFSRAEIVNGGMSFDGVDFGEGGVNFSDVEFGTGDVDFSDAKFGKGDVDFTNAKLGYSRVLFNDVKFGDGNVCFCNVRFCETKAVKGWVSFVSAEFGRGDVDFEAAYFGKGMVTFEKTLFFDGNVTFKDSRLGNEDVIFKDSIFGNGVVNFEDAQFGKGVVLFECTRFGNGKVTFERAQFGNGGVDFNGSEFKTGAVTFRHSRLGTGDFVCDYCAFGGHVSFESLESPERLSKLSLRHSSFDKSLDISGNEFNCIPDLTNTKLTNQVSLDRMEISDNYPLNGDFDKSDGERLCRLKELAEANRSYQKALDLHVIEMRAKRDIRMRDKQDKIKNQNTKRKKLRIYLGEILHRYLDKFFDVVCIYGQSIIRPVLWLLGLTIVCALIYANESSLDYFPLRYGFLYSLSQVFSFVPAGRIITIGILDKLFPCEPQQIPDVIYSLSLIQGVLSFLFLFLIGLGFRNRFRSAR